MSIKVAEIQGWYGPLALSERFIQMLWAEQPWRKEPLRLWNGESLRVLSPGLWNHGAGPDFRKARLELNGQSLLGDVEIHLYPEDWRRHGHDQAPEFAGVVLHVCVFPPVQPDLACVTAAGQELPLWLMAPYLPEDLEHLVDHFREDERHHWRMSLQDAFGQRTEAETFERFARLAGDRFSAKVAFADWLVRRDGWEQACHELLLGYLGMPGNRAAMLACAQHFSWQVMAAPDFSIAGAVDLFANKWRRQAMRPANRPSLRLQQYRRLLQERGNWMQAWQGFQWSYGLPKLEPEQGNFRKLNGLNELRDWIRSDLWAKVWTGSRFDSLVVDVLMPLKQSQSQSFDWFPVWFNWWAGDWPDSYPLAVNEIRLPSPLRRNGYFQGLFEWILNWQNNGALNSIDSK
ncbi:MAG: DUF2851 family protein [Opitutales bacterium]|nr:DUF2851 family protein [Opitutales bacterium]